MVADSLEITTSEDEDDQVRQISLRSLHGKYLIRLFEKRLLIQEKRFSRHGTSVQLKLRRAVDASELRAALRNWIVLPGCSVTFHVTGEAPTLIGYDSLSAALLEAVSPTPATTNERFEVRQSALNGFDIAYVVKWSEMFREWEFARPTRDEYSEQVSDLPPVSCICVQGIAVEFVTPALSRDHC